MADARTLKRSYSKLKELVRNGNSKTQKQEQGKIKKSTHSPYAMENLYIKVNTAD